MGEIDKNFKISKMYIQINKIRVYLICILGKYCAGNYLGNITNPVMFFMFSI